MSSFDPLSGSSTTYKSEPSHPLSAPELPFHDDDDDWVPPTLPGEENLARPFASGAVGSGRSGSRNSARRGSPLDDPLDPLLHSLQDDRSSNGVTERSLENPGAFGSRWMASTSTPAVEHSNGNGAGHAGDSDRPKLADGTLRSADDDFSLRQAVGARNMGTGGGTEFGTGEAVTASSAADGSHFAGVRLSLGYPSFKIGGAGIFKGGNEGMKGVPRSSGPPKDPLESDWHKYLLRDKQVWVPDSVAAACMVCSRPFNLVFRRHHCRRCGACMCGGCSHMAVSDKVLSVNHHTGDVIRIHSGEAVRCCTKCTLVLDYQLSQALQRKGRRARSDATAPTERGTPRGLSSVPTTGGSYVASHPRHSQMDETESFDGGGFAPPSSDHISRTRAGLDSRRGMEHRGFGDDYGAAGNASRGTPNEGFREKQLGEVDQRQPQPQPQPQMSSPSPPPRFEQPPQEQGVPSWLGKRSQGSQNTAGGGRTSRDGPEVKIREKQEVRTMSPPPGAFCDEENATDWSNSRAVV